ncbi:MAG: winged helix-turn-helix transcriptional regulator [Candidatus Thermoplasmatota archaeon]
MTSTKLAGVLLLLALLGSATLAFGQTSSRAPSLQVSGAPVTSDSTIGPTLHVDVAASNASASVVLVVTHDSPAGPVFDRILPITVQQDSVLRLALRGVRLDVPHHLFVMRPQDAPRNMPLVDVPDESTFDATLALARGDVAAAPSETTTAVEVHRLTDFSDSSLGDSRIAVTTDGVVVVADATSGVLSLRASRDGGHQFGQPIVLSTRAGSPLMALRAMGDGTVVLAYKNFTDDAWHLRRWNPITGQFPVVRDFTATDSGGDGGWGLAIDDSGSAFLAVLRFAASDAKPNGVTILRLDPDGSRQVVGNVPTLEAVNGIALAVTGTTATMLFETGGYAGQGVHRFYLTTSANAGSTWTTPEEQVAVEQAFPTGADSRFRGSIGPSGSVQTVLWENPGSKGAYVKCGPSAKACTLVDLTPTNGGVFFGRASASTGARIAVSWFAAGERMMLSDDGGRTWSAPYRLDRGYPNGYRNVFDVAVLPDGRPVTSGIEPSQVGREGPAVATWFDATPTRKADFDLILGEDPIYPTPTPSPTPTAAPPTQTTAPTPSPTPPPPTPAQARVEVTITPSTVDVLPGASASIIITVRNVGDADVTVTMAGVDSLPPGVDVTQRPATEVTVARGESRVLLADVNAANGAVEGNATATLHVRYQGASSGTTPATFRVHVGAPLQVGPGESPAAPNVLVLITLGIAGSAAAVVLVRGAARSDTARVAVLAAALPLYTRISKADILQHEVRAGVYTQVRAQPGARFGELRQALDLSNGVLVFHLRVLEREGYVRVHKEWTRLRYYPSDVLVQTTRVSAPQSVTQLVAQEPGITAAAVAKRLGISRQLARYHLKSLERQGQLAGGGAGYHAKVRP